MERLAGCLRQCQARQVIVMSTVEVYPRPVDVDEKIPQSTRRISNRTGGIGCSWKKLQNSKVLVFHEFDEA